MVRVYVLVNQMNVIRDIFIFLWVNMTLSYRYQSSLSLQAHLLKETKACFLDPLFHYLTIPEEVLLFFHSDGGWQFLACAGHLDRRMLYIKPVRRSDKADTVGWNCIVCFWKEIILLCPLETLFRLICIKCKVSCFFNSSFFLLSCLFLHSSILTC